MKTVGKGNTKIAHLLMQAGACRVSMARANLHGQHGDSAVAAAR